MKIWAVLLAVSLSVLTSNASFDYPLITVPAPSTVHVISKQAGIDLTTSKVIHLFDDVTPRSVSIALQEGRQTQNLPGDRVVIIDSPGGSVAAGQRLIDALLREHNSGTRIVCVATENAHSMAFNTLSFCDVRLATAYTVTVAHKVAIQDLTVRGTAKNLRRIADQLDIADEPYSVQNAKMMHMSREEYDRYADAEYMWTAIQLLRIGYLDGIATIK